MRQNNQIPPALEIPKLQVGRFTVNPPTPFSKGEWVDNHRGKLACFIPGRTGLYNSPFRTLSHLRRYHCSYLYTFLTSLMSCRNRRRLALFWFWLSCCCCLHSSWYRCSVDGHIHLPLRLENVVFVSCLRHSRL